MSNISDKNNVETIVYKGHGFISIIKYNKYGDLLFIGDKDSKKIILYDVINKNIIGEYTGHNGVVWGIEITDDSQYMFSCSGDLSVIMWNVYDGSIINKLELKGIPKNICYNNDNKKLLVYCSPLSKRSIPTLYIYNTINFQEPIIFTFEENKITSLNWLNNDVIIVSYESGEIEFINLLDKEKNEKYKLHDNIIKSVNFNNTKTKFVTGSIDKTCKIFDIETRKVEQTIVSDISINSALFFPLRNYIIMGGGLDALLVAKSEENDCSTKFYSMKNKLSGIMFSHFGPVRIIDISASNLNYATAGQDGMVKICYFNKEFSNKFLVYNYENIIDRKLFNLELSNHSPLTTENIIYQEMNLGSSVAVKKDQPKLNENVEAKDKLYKIKNFVKNEQESEPNSNTTLYKINKDQNQNQNQNQNSDNMTTIKISNLPPDVRRDDLIEEFDLFGRIKDKGVHIKNYNNDTVAFINYEDSSSAQKAFKHKNGDKFNYMIIKIEILKDKL